MTTITCEECKAETPKENSRKWKNDRYCKKCWKKVTKEERDLTRISANY